jgi:predicted ATPase with chaperone activity
MAADRQARLRPGAADDNAPVAPKSIEETGLEPNFLLMLMLKTIYVTGLETASTIRERLGLSRRIVTALLEDALELGLLEILGRTAESHLADLRHAMTGKGREWAVEALSQSKYVGAAPVTLSEYHAQVQKQRITNERINGEMLARCFTDLTLEDELINDLGPAVSSGRAILFYGPPGNGKTSVARAIGNVFEDAIFVPHSLEVDGQVIKVFDSTVHTPVTEADEAEISGERGRGPRLPEADGRWVRCRRPLVITGGELTLEMLDLSFNTSSRFYEAPLQLKATNGIFAIDDFGRQKVSAEEVLNRWIIPLERHVDYLTLDTGKQFPVPFDGLVIFSTNHRPKELMDDAMMRRIPYKIEFREPNEADYRKIFNNVCAAHNIVLREDILRFLFDEYYNGQKIPIARYHPKWIVDQVIGRREYEGVGRELDRQQVVDALRNLYTAY